jgi:hypothetical protein
MRTVTGLFVALFTIGCGNEAKHSGPATSPSNVVPTGEPVLQDLGDEYDLGDYRIRPPKGFVLKSDDEMPRNGGRLVVWRTPDDLMGFSVALIILSVEQVPATTAKIRSIGRPTGMTDVEESPPQHETIDGLEFETCTSEYSYRNGDKRYSSLIYSHANGPKGILITYSGQPREDDQRWTAARAAIRSFRRP